MAQNIFRTSTRTCSKKANCIINTSSNAHFSSKTSGWFRRFLSPKEEKELYLGITSSFRDKLIEQSNKSTQTYSNIIEHAIFSTKSPLTKVNKTSILSAARMEQLKLELDTAGKQEDIDKLRQLELEMIGANLQTVTMYNRLIRSYLWSKSIDSAQKVLNDFEKRGLIPTTRTFTYLIQAYLKKGELDQAKSLIEQMQHLSLLRLRTSFDISVMMKYYTACGDSHAIDFLWRDVTLHIDTIKPGTGLFTQYLEHLLAKKDIGAISQLTQDFLIHQDHQQLNAHQYLTWIKAIRLLTAKSANNHNTQSAEHILLYIAKKAPPKMTWDKVKESIANIITSYLEEDRELKALAFYYRLRKLGIPDQVFEPALMKSIDSVLQKVEQRQRTDGSEENKAIIAELEGLIVASIKT